MVIVVQSTDHHARAEVGPTRNFSTFTRWANLAVTRAWGISAHHLGEDRAERIWRYAHRNVAAQLAIACIRDRLVRRAVRDGRVVLDVDGRPWFPIHAVDPFGLPIPNLDGNRHPALEDPVATLRALGPVLRLDRETRSRVGEHLIDATFNLALAVLASELRDQLSKSTIQDPRVSVPEHFVSQGHPGDPLALDRVGLGLRENILHGPEQLASTPVHAIDVRDGLVEVTPAFKAITWGLFGSPDEGWIRLPVHAATLRRLPQLLPAAWGSLVRESEARAQPGRTLLGLGTVALQPRLAAVICLELAPGTSAGHHSTANVSVTDRPRLSMALARIRGSDPVLADGPDLIKDRAGARLDSSRLGPAAAELDVLVRESASAHTPDETKAWVCAALGERWPGRYETLLDHASAGYPGSKRRRAEFFLRDYLRLLVRPVLRYCCAHGVGIDASLASTLLLVRDGRPVGFLFRDLARAKCHPGRLAASGHRIDVAASSPLFAASLSELHAHVCERLFEDHLGTVFGWLDDELGLPRAQSWEVTSRFVRTLFDGWVEDAATAQAATEDATALLGHELPATPMLPRILGVATSAKPIALQNPLAAAAAARAA